MSEDHQGKIYITGDKHGSVRFLFGLAEKKLMRPEDVLIITGDAGYVWDENYPAKAETIEQLFPGTLCFIDGNHENHRILNSLPADTWQGGRVHRIGNRVLHLMRGEIYEICGKRIFCFGGARTVSRYVEGVEGTDWWIGEEPTRAETEYAERKLFEHAEDIDYIITHEAPLSARSGIARQKRIDDDYLLPAILEEWLTKIRQSTRLKRWYFGHMHVDQEIPPFMRAIFNNVLELDTGRRIPWA